MTFHRPVSAVMGSGAVAPPLPLPHLPCWWREVPWLHRTPTPTPTLLGAAHTQLTLSCTEEGGQDKGYQLGILKTDLNPEMTVLAHCLGLISEESIRKRESPGLEQRIKEDPPSEAWDTKAWAVTGAFSSSGYFAGGICWLIHHRHLFPEGRETGEAEERLHPRHGGTYL